MIVTLESLVPTVPPDVAGYVNTVIAGFEPRRPQPTAAYLTPRTDQAIVFRVGHPALQNSPTFAVYPTATVSPPHLVDGFPLDLVPGHPERDRLSLPGPGTRPYAVKMRTAGQYTESAGVQRNRVGYATVLQVSGRRTRSDSAGRQTGAGAVRLSAS
jgi:hypothetical protein